MAGGASQDCNENDIPNECDIAGGVSDDCSLNGVPDECEPDADADGIPDQCDQLGEFDHDADIDLDDYEMFEICLYLFGTQEPAPFVECRDRFDWDADEDVDLADIGGFQEFFTRED